MINRQLKNNVIEIYEDDALVLMISETISGCTMLMRVFGKLKSTVAFELEDELMAALTVCDVIRVDMPTSNIFRETPCSPFCRCSA